MKLFVGGLPNGIWNLEYGVVVQNLLSISVPGLKSSLK